MRSVEAPSSSTSRCYWISGADRLAATFPERTPSPDAVVVSHGHLDHVGTIPALVSGDARPPIHWTPPTYELAMTLARDTLKLHGGTVNVRAPRPTSDGSHRCRRPTATASRSRLPATRSPSTTPATFRERARARRRWRHRLLYTAISTPTTSASWPGRRRVRTRTRSSVRAPIPMSTTTPAKGRGAVRRERRDDALGGRDRRRARLRNRSNTGDAARLRGTRHPVLRRRDAEAGDRDARAVPRVRPRRGALQRANSHVRFVTGRTDSESASPTRRRLSSRPAGCSPAARR